jgi:hypothetical protein
MYKRSEGASEAQDLSLQVQAVVLNKSNRAQFLVEKFSGTFSSPRSGSSLNRRHAAEAATLERQIAARLEAIRLSKELRTFGMRSVKPRAGSRV